MCNRTKNKIELSIRKNSPGDPLPAVCIRDCQSPKRVLRLMRGILDAQKTSEVNYMKSDGPLILAIVFLAAGLIVIFSYGTGSSGFNAAYPLSGANLQLAITTTGPAAVGGLALTALGVLTMAWALICAFFGLFQPAVIYRDRPSRLEREDQKRLDREERLQQKRLDHEEKLLEREERVRPSYPKQ